VKDREPCTAYRRHARARNVDIPETLHDASQASLEGVAQTSLFVKVRHRSAACDAPHHSRPAVGPGQSRNRCRSSNLWNGPRDRSTAWLSYLYGFGHFFRAYPRRQDTGGVDPCSAHRRRTGWGARTERMCCLISEIKRRSALVSGARATDTHRGCRCQARGAGNRFGQRQACSQDWVGWGQIAPMGTVCPKIQRFPFRDIACR